MIFNVILQAASAVVVQSAGVDEQVVARPDWIGKPGGADVARNFPERAMASGLSGKATLQCRVSSQGGLEACEVEDEMPVGRGFREAALHLAALFRMKAHDQDGQETAGRKVRIPILFRLPLTAVAGPVEVVDARFAGATVEVDCRSSGTKLDNCMAVNMSPSSRELSEAAVAVVSSAQPGKMPSGRILLRLKFVAPSDRP